MALKTNPFTGIAAPCGAPGGRRRLSSLVFGGHPAMRNVRGFVTNRFAGTCEVCGSAVPAGAGGTQKVQGRWKVFC